MSDQTFGEAVGEARSMLSLSKEGAAARLGMSTAMLEDVESGLIPPNPVLVAKFEEAYEIRINLENTRTERDHAPRRPLVYDAEQGRLTLGEMVVEFRVGVDDNDHLLGQFSGALRRLRRQSPGTPLTLRQADLPMLAQLIDLEDPELDQRARFWFGQDPREGQSFATLLKLSRPPEQNAA